MIRNKKSTSGPMIIDITGPAGNAFSLMGQARNLAKQLGMDPNPIIEGMMSGDYENLLQVFDDNFGDYVILER